MMVACRYRSEGALPYPREAKMVDRVLFAAIGGQGLASSNDGVGNRSREESSISGSLRGGGRGGLGDASVSVIRAGRGQKDFCGNEEGASQKDGARMSVRVWIGAWGG